MKRTDIIREIWRKNRDLGLSWEDSERFVKLFFREIKGSMAKGGRVELRGLGVLGVRYRRGRTARNPKTGDRVEVSAKRVPYFKTSKKLSDRMNGGEK